MANSARQLGVQQAQFISEFIDKRNSTGGSCTIPKIQRALEKEFDLVLPRSQIYRAVHTLGYQYVHVRGHGAIIDQEKRTERIRKYLVELDSALAAQAT